MRRGGVDVPGAFLLGYFVEGGGAVVGGVAVGGLEEGTGAGGGVAGVEGDGGGNGGGEGGVGGGAVGAAKVADVAAHEDEGCGCCAGEAGYVAYGVLLGGGVLLSLRICLVGKGLMGGRELTPGTSRM